MWQTSVLIFSSPLLFSSLVFKHQKPFCSIPLPGYNPSFFPFSLSPFLVLFPPSTSCSFPILATLFLSPPSLQCKKYLVIFGHFSFHIAQHFLWTFRLLFYNCVIFLFQLVLFSSRSRGYGKILVFFIFTHSRGDKYHDLTLIEIVILRNRSDALQ